MNTTLRQATLKGARAIADWSAQLGGFVVAEDYRGQGSGGTLLAAVEEWARARGISKLRVRSRSERTESRNFFRRLGFRHSKDQHVFDKELDPED